VSEVRMGPNERAVSVALERRYARAMEEMAAQSDPGLLDELAVGHTGFWRWRVVRAARAMCGDPFCRYDSVGFDADAMRYLSRFG